MKLHLKISIALLIITISNLVYAQGQVFSTGTQQTFGGKSYAFNHALEHIKYIKLKS